MNSLIETLLLPTTQVAMIIGLAEIVKRFGLDKRWIPLVDLALGIASGVVVFGKSVGIVNGILLGIAEGLSACGLFSGIKNVIGK